MKVLVWNCNGLTNDKHNDAQFIEILFQNDIVILSESWTEEYFDYELPNFVSFNFHRKFKSKKARRNSGGIVVYVRDYVSRGVKIISNRFDTLIWLKLQKSFFDIDDDIYLCGTYLWPDESPAAKYYNVNLFDVLQEDIFYYDQIGTVLIAGDFNARTGSKPDFIVSDSTISEPDENDYLFDTACSRASQDKTCNARGSQLLDICKSTDLLIANGRLGNDCEKGAFSYFSKQSCTTIDYFLLKADDFSMINQFSLGNFTTFSDHAPLCFDLKMTSIPRDKDRQNYFCTYIKWDSGQRDVFRRNIIGNLPSFNEIVQQACSDEMDINSMVERLSNRIYAAADPLFRRKSNKLEPKKTNSCHWFDLECKLAKNEYKSILKNFNKN